ncbi:long-chain-fatty-acid--CoA ligase [Halovulum sp. GXIMD14793]
MLGQMMHRPLMISEILKYGEQIHGRTEMITQTVEGGIHRYTYADAALRTRKLAQTLLNLGVKPADRIATLAWNTYRHFELYFATSGIQAICHTINPRLPHEQLSYILHHADDQVLFVDLTFVPILEAIANDLPKGMRIVVMTDAAHMPDTALPDLLCYETLVGAEDGAYVWPEFDEQTASSLCYTSGTTGNPKGALYSHRSTLLHAMLVGLTPMESMRDERKILPVVPMFHVNAWGLPYAAPLVGASLVHPGPRLDGESLFTLMDAEGVFSSWGVPTVWLGLLAEIHKQGRKPGGLGEIIVGGSAAPRSMIAEFEDMGVSVCHAWGMTEMSPIGTQGLLMGADRDLPREDMLDLKQRQGRRVFGVDLKIVDEDGNEQPQDDTAVGELFVRGNSVVSGYFNNEEATNAAVDADGWFGTGDVAKISSDGVLTITDRVKDLIKSGGEWISSIDVENVAMAHPKVANCAVIAVAHPKWNERPLLIVVPAGDEKPTKEELDTHLLEHLAKWQLPDDVVYMDELPLTATGKVSKLKLRAAFADYKLPGTE